MTIFKYNSNYRWIFFVRCLWNLWLSIHMGRLGSSIVYSLQIIVHNHKSCWMDGTQWASASAVAIQLAKAVLSTVIQGKNIFIIIFESRKVKCQQAATRRPNDHDGKNSWKYWSHLKEIFISHKALKIVRCSLWDWEDEMRMVLVGTDQCWCRWARRKKNGNSWAKPRNCWTPVSKWGKSTWTGTWLPSWLPVWNFQIRNRTV